LHSNERNLLLDKRLGYLIFDCCTTSYDPNVASYTDDCNRTDLAHIFTLLDNIEMHRKTNVPVFNDLDDPALIKALFDDGVGVLLTDTVYGIVGRAQSHKAAQGVIEAKGRKHKPGTLIAASVQQLIDLGLPAHPVHIANHFWPGPVSVVIPAGPELAYIHLGKDSIVVRIPDKPELVRLLKTVGPLLTTSANLPDEPMVTSIEEAQELFGERLSFYVDGGSLPNPVASTIITINIEVLRQGVVPIDGATYIGPTIQEKP
jgi:L-threonylcarbamoyladenylate synthase